MPSLGSARSANLQVPPSSRKSVYVTSLLVCCQGKSKKCQAKLGRAVFACWLEPLGCCGPSAKLICGSHSRSGFLPSSSPEGAEARAFIARLAQPEASECEAVRLGKWQRIGEPRRGDTVLLGCRAADRVRDQRTTISERLCGVTWLVWHSRPRLC